MYWGEPVPAFLVAKNAINVTSFIRHPRAFDLNINVTLVPSEAGWKIHFVWDVPISAVTLTAKTLGRSYAVTSRVASKGWSLDHLVHLGNMKFMTYCMMSSPCFSV